MSDYQSAFSMFLASHQEDSVQSVDSPGIPSSENSQDSSAIPNTQNTQLSVREDSTCGMSKASELSNDTGNLLRTCPSVESMTWDNSNTFAKTLKPHAPPPSEDANQELLSGNDDEPVDISAESVDDTPHFQVSFSQPTDKDNEESCDQAVDIQQMPPPSFIPESIDIESCNKTGEFKTPANFAVGDTNSGFTQIPNVEDCAETNIPDQPIEPEIPDAEKLYEYQWPQETGGDIYMIQEHVSEFLQILSFKRKYPDLSRRPVEYDERIFLLEKGVVTETQCNLGLTALRSEEVYDLLSKDYPIKFKEYQDVFAEREKKRISEQNKGYALQSIEKAKVDYHMKKAVKSAADFNAQFMREKREERRAYLDLQTMEVHYPKSKIKVVGKEFTNPGTYPVALIPGQYQNYYKQYTSQELKYFPVKTALYSPHKVLKTIFADPGNAEPPVVVEPLEKKAEGESSSSEGSHSASSDSEADSIEPEVNEVKISEEQIKKLLAVKRPDTPPKKRRKRAAPNTSDATESGKDSETGSVKVPKKRGPKTPRAKTPGRKPGRTPKGSRPKGRPPLPRNQPCNICQEIGLKDKDGQYVELAQCSECYKYAHLDCLELTSEMVPMIKKYAWQCMECKTCIKCKDSQDEEHMMFCDRCDRGYHTYCVGLKVIPPGRWECPHCDADKHEETMETEDIPPAETDTITADTPTNTDDTATADPPTNPDDTATADPPTATADPPTNTDDTATTDPPTYTDDMATADPPTNTDNMATAATPTNTDDMATQPAQPETEAEKTE